MSFCTNISWKYTSLNILVQWANCLFAISYYIDYQKVNLFDWVGMMASFILVAKLLSFKEGLENELEKML
jgi:hypothetical protein